MATTTTTVAMQGTTFPYIGPTQGYLGVPVAELLFFQAAAITVAGSGEDQILNITMALPKGWAYVLSELNFEISGADAADWDDCVRCQIRDSVASPSFSANLTLCSVPGETWSTSTAIKGKTYQLLDPLKKTIISNQAGDGRVFLNVMNRVIDGAAGNTEIFCRLLRYSLEQAHHFSVNNPMPVR